MSQAIQLNVLPEKHPLKTVLLRKCIKQLEKLKQFGAHQFVHDSIDFIGSGAFKSSRYEGIPPADLQAVAEAYKLFISQTINLELSKNQVLEDLSTLGLTSETATAVWEATTARKSEIKQVLSLQQATISQNYLKDFDWKLNLSLASDKISKMRQPLLSVELKVHQNSNGEDRFVTIEMTRSELDDFIATLDEINRELIKLKA